jgi:hypothetical protein
VTIFKLVGYILNLRLGGHYGFIFYQMEPDEKHSKTYWISRQLARFFADIEETHDTNSAAEQAVVRAVKIANI